MTDATKVRLAATVVVTDGAGDRHTFRPGDEIPGWARAKITNPSAWGHSTSPAPGPATDFGHASPIDPTDGLPAYIDVVCSAKHKRRIVARFEVGVLLELAEPARWEWHWTTAQVPGGVDTDDAGEPLPKRARVAGGFVDVPTDRGPRHAVVHGPGGLRKVRLRCCGLDLPIRWENWTAMLDSLRHAGQQEVNLSALARTVTR